VIQGDGVEHVQVLPLVFVEALDLDVEQALRIDLTPARSRVS